MELSELIKTPKVDGVYLHDQLHATIEGTLCVTGHYLLLSARENNVKELWLMHKNIDAMEKKPFIVQNILIGGLITLKCKDLRIISLEIRYADEFNNVAASLEALSSLHNTDLEYPFFYRPMYSILENGYIMYRLEQEFARLSNDENCANLKNHSNTSNDGVGCEWRITYINKNFTMCSTYGELLIVPKSITDEQIVHSAAFREGGRFPVLSYKHKNGAALLRSAHPSTVNRMKRCRADEALLNDVLGKRKKGFIIDTWAKGKSNSETDLHYTQWKKINRSIGNILSPSSILDSFAKLVEACNDINCLPDKWLSRLAGSHWLTLVLNSLNVACVVAQCIDRECSPVLVHGAKGLDTPLIVNSLAQIILNSDCRTVRGMQALIEREWIQAGHPFATRHRYSCYTPVLNRPKNCGATFVLFLDCVHQIYKQFPCSFEFNTQFLILLYENSYYSQYGTFLCDSERERKQFQIHSRTVSLWSHLNRPDILENLLNPLYQPNPTVIWPSVAPISFELWSELYLRWNINETNIYTTTTEINKLLSKEKELRAKTLHLRKQAIELAKEVSNIINT